MKTKSVHLLKSNISNICNKKNNQFNMMIEILYSMCIDLVLEIEELKNEITLLNERMETYKNGYTWGSRLGISSMIAFIIWYFTKKWKTLTSERQ